MDKQTIYQMLNFTGYSEKEKKDGWIWIRYLLFYLSYLSILSLISSVLDNILYDWLFKRGDRSNGVVAYFLFYLIMGYIIFPVSIAYNYFINNLVPKKNLVRLILGPVAALLAGFFLTIDFDFGSYINEYRELKNIVAVVLSGFLVEVLRIFVVHLRYQARK